MRRGRLTRSLLRTHIRVDSPAGLLDLPAVGLQKLSKLSACECVKKADANPDLAEAARCAPVGLR